MLLIEADAMTNIMEGRVMTREEAEGFLLRNPRVLEELRNPRVLEEIAIHQRFCCDLDALYLFGAVDCEADAMTNIMEVLKAIRKGE